METKEVVSQQALQQFPAPGTGAVNFPGGPGNVPEMHHGEIRDTLAEEGWAERQVVILQPDNRWLFATCASLSQMRRKVYCGLSGGTCT